MAALLVFLVVVGCSSSDAPTDDEDAMSADQATDNQPERPEMDTRALHVDDDGVLRDELDRQVLLRGVNAGGRSKFPPFLPFPFSESGRPEQSGAAPFDEALENYAGRLTEWGLNTVRLPFTWEAVESVRGTYDEAYLARYEALARHLGELGFHVIIDYHQDVFARPFCGDGFPYWAIEGEPPEPPDDCRSWVYGYINPGPVRDNFERFWNNDDGLRDALTQMWQMMARRLWGIKGVVGFEIINEPGEGTSGGAWATDVLVPFYSEMIAVIQAEAAGALVFFDATGTSALTASTDLVRPEGDGIVFAPHFYDATMFLGGELPTDPNYDDALARWAAKGAEWGVPVLIGEFGARRDLERGFEYLRANYDALDLSLLHATMWEYSTTVDEWNDEMMSVIDLDGDESHLVAAIVRPYPAATVGTINSFSYDSADRTGTLVFTPGDVSGITEIVVPTRVFPNGVDASLEGGGWIRYDPPSQRLLIRTDFAQERTVRFWPASE